MLGKLLKYDLKNVNKVLFIFTILGFIFSILTRIFFELDNSLVMHIIGQVMQGITIAMLVSLFINCFMRNWVRLTRNLYGDESYLTHTLPVKNSSIYLAKFLSGTISMLMSIVVAIICIVIMYLNKANLDALHNLLNTITSSENGVILIVLGCITVFLEFLSLLVSGYMGLILGHKSNDYKIVKSIIYSFIIYMISQGFIILVIYLLGLVKTSIGAIFTSNAMLNMEDLIILLITSIIAYTIYIVVNTLTCIKLLNKGVNVD